jgi:hypothetical protein
MWKRNLEFNQCWRPSHAAYRTSRRIFAESKKVNLSTVFEQASWIEHYTSATKISALTRSDFMRDSLRA